MSQRHLSAVVLAAGAGTRMKSERPKPLHQLCGRPMVVHVLSALDGVDVDWAVLVVGHGAERVVKKLNDDAPLQWSLHYVEQVEQKGTGDAVSIALASLPEHLSDEAEDADVLILPGDTPLLRPQTIVDLVAQHRETEAAATMLTVEIDDPSGYGRVIRDRHGRVRRVVEQADASAEEAAVKEINTSVYCFKTSLLGPALRRISPVNAQGEFYLTDVIHVLAEGGHRVEAMAVNDASEASGVNDRVQLAEADAVLRARINQQWMKAGVSMVDPATTYIDVDVRLESDVTLHPNTWLHGSTRIASGAEIGPGTRLIECSVGQNSRIPRCEGRLASVGADVEMGPFCVLEPGAVVADSERVPSFTTRHGAGE